MVVSLEILTQNLWRIILTSLHLILITTSCIPTSSEANKIQVFAASSMQDVMRDAKIIFENQHPNADIIFNFSGSQVLRLQIEQGAPASLFVSANQEHIQALQQSGHIHKDRLVAHNELVIVTPENNPQNITELKDLRNAARIVIGTVQSPIGVYTRTMLQKASLASDPRLEEEVMAHVVSQENNVRLIRAKVALGEADAALVYRTDTVNASKIRTISIPPHLNIKAAYIMGLTQRASKNDLANAFFDFFDTPKGIALLTRHGFVVN